MQRADKPECEVEHEVVETGSQSSKPFAMIEQVLKLARVEREQIDGLAVGLGPGSYTGIRACIALAQGWQLGLEVNLYGLSSAECLAAQTQAEGRTGRIAVVVDAQRGEFYLANYELTSGGWREVQPLRLVSQTTVSDCQKEGALLVGPEVLNWFPRGRTTFPRAATLGKLALTRDGAISGEKLEPIYLRATSFVKAPAPRVLPG